MNQYYQSDQCIIRNHGYLKDSFSIPDRPIEEKVINMISGSTLLNYGRIKEESQ